MVYLHLADVEAITQSIPLFPWCLGFFLFFCFSPSLIAVMLLPEDNNVIDVQCHDPGLSAILYNICSLGALKVMGY